MTLVEQAQEFFGSEPFEIIGLDAGAAYLVKNHGDKYMTKIRKDYEGVVGYRPVEGLVCEFDVQDKNVLLVDDMISTGSTMMTGVGKIKTCGAKKICVAAVHGLFVFDSAEQIKKLTDCVFSTDSIPSPQAQVSIKDKLTALA